MPVFFGFEIDFQRDIRKNDYFKILYERYFETSTNRDYAEFLAKDWNADDLTPTDITRIQMAVITYLVDIFDVYDKVQEGLVTKSHLETRMNTLKLGVMKTTAAKVVWSYWKNNREQSFIDWFESEIYDDEAGNVSLEESLKMSKEVNTVR